MDSMAARLLEMIDCPVVPAGIFALATTTDVVTGATLTLDPVFLLAPFTLANAIALPATNRMTPITTNMSVWRFTETFPLRHGDHRVALVTSPTGLGDSVGGYDETLATYIGPSDHSALQDP